MKKVFCLIFAIALILSSVAIAEPAHYSHTFTAKDGYNVATAEKESGVGVSAKVENIGGCNGHSMYYQVRKGNVQSSEYAIKKGNGSVSMAYKKDGNGESLGRTGYSYRLRVAHRTQCTCKKGTSVTASGSFRP